MHQSPADGWSRGKGRRDLRGLRLWLRVAPDESAEERAEGNVVLIGGVCESDESAEELRHKVVRTDTLRHGAPGSNTTTNEERAQRLHTLL